jgi:hypothetical protein
MRATSMALLTGLLLSFNRVLMSLLGMLVRGRRVLFGLFVPALTVLVRCLMMVMSSGSLMCSSCIMMLGSGMFCYYQDR